MQTLKPFGCVIFALLLAVPDATLAQKNGNQTGKPVQGTAQEYALLKKLKEVAGRLAYVDSSTKNLTLDIDYQYPVPNKNYRNVGRNYPRNYRGNNGRMPNMRMPNVNVGNFQNQMQNIMRQQQQLMTIRNPVQRAQRMAQLEMQMERLEMQMMMSQAQAAASVERMQMQMLMAQARTMANVGRQAMRNAAANPGFKLVKGTKQFELEAKDDVVVRRWTLPIDYDDKGNVKEYSKDELKALRGKDSSLPGYTAQYLDLQPGQLVKFYLATAKAKKDKEDDPVAGLKDGPIVRVILILADADRAMPAVANNNKKKKNN